MPIKANTLSFIKNIIFDTMLLDFNYLRPPYGDITVFDRQFRAGLKDSEGLYRQCKEYLAALEHHNFYFCQDDYSMRYVFFYPYQDKKDLVVIGPYLIEAINSDFLSTISEQNHLKLNDVEKLKGFLYGLPVLDTNIHLVAAITDILTYINPEAEPFSIEYQDFLTKENTFEGLLPKEDFDSFVNTVQKRYQIEEDLMKYIAEGNYELAVLEGKKFISQPIEPRIRSSIRDQKALLFSANTLFRKAVEANHIHPVFLHEISSKYANIIENTPTPNGLNHLYEKMIRDYCLLVRNKSMKQFSAAIREILNYIEFNLDAPLTLAELAEAFHISIPYMSNLFKKELGTTIISYINNQRIKEAIRLLNSTKMSIQEIASQVGIVDSNYFTKVFKKVIGCTPKEYKKRIS